MEQQSTTKSRPVEQDQETEKSHGSPLRWLQWIPLLFLVYLLSTGPVAWVSAALGNNHPGIEAVAETVYAPITAVADRYPPARRLLLWYIGKVWRVESLHPHYHATH